MSATHFHRPKPVIFVTGATGNVGRHVVRDLLNAGAGVRALSRDPGAVHPPGAERVTGDLASTDTLDGALRGVSAVFLVWPFFTAEHAPAVVRAVRRHTRRIVYLSSMGVRDGAAAQADPINQFHADVERHIADADMEWTFLRPSGFAANTLGWADEIRAGGVVRQPYAAAARSLIHERDIAAVAVRALLHAGHAGKMHLISGPRALAQAEQARLIGEAIGRPVRFDEIPPEVARAEMVGAGWPDEVADGALRAWAGFAAEPERVTRTVDEVTGSPARTFAEWARDHAADFR